MIGAKLYSIPEKRDSFIAEWKSIGLDTAFLGPDIWMDPRGFPQELSDHGIDSNLILQTFFDPLMEEHPQDYAILEDGSQAKDDWVTFCCPRAEGFLEKRIAQLKEGVEQCSPRGISIDFIRYFAFWELVTPENWLNKLKDSCFCPRCTKAFQEHAEIAEDISQWPVPQRARYIHQNHGQSWIDFKCRTITESFQKIVDSCKSADPELKVFFHGLPWLKEEYNGARSRIGGQDFKAIGEIADFISPMCYTHMLYKGSEWLDTLVKAQAKDARVPIIPAIQVSECYRKEEFNAEEFKKIESTCLNQDSKSLILWSWEYLKESPAKIETLKESIKD